VEASMKLARRVTGRQGIFVFRGGFHGRTMGSVTYTTSNAKYRRGYHPLLPSVFVAPFPHPFHWGMSEEEATEHALLELTLKLKHEVMPDEVAAFLVEPVQGEGGYYPAPAAFLRRLREMADEHGILLVLDEVQTGFGRTGKWFAGEHYGIEPDVLVLGKAIANGLPLSAVGARARLQDAWPTGSHGTTFGGNPVACAAAAANVDVLAGMIPEVPALAERAFARFAGLAAHHPTIGDVRGLGLMIGVELVEPGTNTPDPAAFPFLARHAREHGLFLLDCGPDANIIRFVPPLCVTGEELDLGIDIIDAALSAYERK
jgi:4-aminobutyrate aminotransferase